MKDYFKLLNNKKILVTGHTGFKGSWLCMILKKYGAEICGISLPPPTNPSLFELTNLSSKMESNYCDIRDYDTVFSIMSRFQPEIVIHLAAQPIVRESYINPRGTYEINVMGTVNILESIRNTNSVKSFLNVTTDKVYYNNEWCWGYRENEPLDGYDPYSNSKSCSELVTHSYIRSFFSNSSSVRVSTARAGNVIGGGDYAIDRIIPDCVRAVINNKPILLRNPYSVRPYQHVLEPLFAYLLIALKQEEEPSYAGFYNIGPNEESCISTGGLAKLFIAHWGNGTVKTCELDDALHEASYLKLDCSKIKKTLGWEPHWNINAAVEKTVEWYKKWNDQEDIVNCMETQIDSYLSQENQ